MSNSDAFESCSAVIFCQEDRVQRHKDSFTRRYDVKKAFFRRKNIIYSRQGHIIRVICHTFLRCDQRPVNIPGNRWHVDSMVTRVRLQFERLALDKR